MQIGLLLTKHFNYFSKNTFRFEQAIQNASILRTVKND